MARALNMCLSRDQDFVSVPNFFRFGFSPTRRKCVSLAWCASLHCKTFKIHYSYQSKFHFP